MHKGQLYPVLMYYCIKGKLCDIFVDFVLFLPQMTEGGGKLFLIMGLFNCNSGM